MLSVLASGRNEMATADQIYFFLKKSNNDSISSMLKVTSVKTANMEMK